VKRLPTKDEVRAYLVANAKRRDDRRWDVPSLGGSTHPLFEPAALKVAEVCLILGVPLSDVISSDLALALARRIAVLEEHVDQYKILATAGTQEPIGAAE
jgi:hypothetical protein